jgi:hypothetical protein
MPAPGALAVLHRAVLYSSNFEFDLGTVKHALRDAVGFRASSISSEAIGPSAGIRQSGSKRGGIRTRVLQQSRQIREVFVEVLFALWDDGPGLGTSRPRQAGGARPKPAVARVP